jgi:glycosyltransferase involved in cell wall biosynthesis
MPESPMKIAIYTHYFTPEVSAPSTRLHDLARLWLDLGHQVQVITCFPNHPTGHLYPGYRRGLYQHEMLDGIEVHRHWTYRTSNQGVVKKSLGHLSFLPAALLISNSHIGRPDVVIGSSPTFPAAEAAARTAKHGHIPFVMEVRDLWPAVFTELGVTKHARVSRLLEKIELGLYRRATRIVTVTEAFRTNLLSRDVPRGKVVTVTNGADIDFWQPREPPQDLRRRLGVSGAFVVLYIGTHGISHGLGAVLTSAIQLRDNMNIHFVFVGDGAEKRSLVEQARVSNLPNVHFIDSVNKAQVREYYALADVCLVPLKNIKLFDGFIPSKTFEIMAMGRPIVGSVRGEIADLLHGSGGAIVVEPENPAQLSDALLRLCSNPGLRRSMGAAGRRFVVENYSRKHLAEAYVRVLEEAIQERSSS